MTDYTEISLDLLVMQIQDAMKKDNGNELVKVLRLCSRLLTPDQLARVKYLVNQEVSNA